MMKSRLFCVMLLVGCFAVTGCGSDGGNASTAADTQAVIAPSAAVLPFGIESISLPIDDDEQLNLDFVYNDLGQLVEASMTREGDENGDGRPDGMTTTVYSLDPDIPRVDQPALEFFGTPKSARSAAPLARVAAPIYEGVTDYLPGTIVQIEHSRHTYRGDRAAQIPEALILDYRQTVDYEYDDTGRVVKMISTSEDDDRIRTTTQEWSYDPSGQPTREKRVYQNDQYKDGWIDDKEVDETSYRYDANGRLAEKTLDRYGDEELEKTLYSYDETGALVKEEFQRIDRREETIEEQRTTTYTFAENGRLDQKIIASYRFDDEGNPVIEDKNTHTFHYDGSGRLIEKIHQDDQNGDPAVIEQTITHTYTYGEFGVQSYEWRREPSAYAGETRSYAFSYNEAGQLTEKRYMYDNSSDGADDFDIDTYVYDAAGRLIEMQTADYDAVDGEPADVPDDKEVRTFAYDDQGRLTEWHYEDYDNGVDVDERISAALSYDPAGKSATGTMQKVRWDDDAADGLGALVPTGPARSINCAFAAGAPTAAIDIPVEHLPDWWSSQSEAFERITLTVPYPALQGVAEGAWMFGFET